MDFKDFKASKGWLDWWNNRHNVVFGTASDKNRLCTVKMTEIWEQTHLPMILSRYELRDIYKIDKFFYFINSF